MKRNNNPPAPKDIDEAVLTGFAKALEQAMSGTVSYDLQRRYLPQIPEGVKYQSYMIPPLMETVETQELLQDACLNPSRETMDALIQSWVQSIRKNPRQCDRCPAKEMCQTWIDAQTPGVSTHKKGFTREYIAAKWQAFQETKIYEYLQTAGILLGFFGMLLLIGLFILFAAITAVGLVPMWDYFVLTHGAPNLYIMALIGLIGWLPFATANFLFGFATGERISGEFQYFKKGEHKILPFDEPKWLNHLPLWEAVSGGVKLRKAVDRHADRLWKRTEYWFDEIRSVLTSDYCRKVVLENPSQFSNTVRGIAITLDFADYLEQLWSLFAHMQTRQQFRSKEWFPETISTWSTSRYAWRLSILLAGDGFWDHVELPIITHDEEESISDSLFGIPAFVLGFLRADEYRPHFAYEFPYSELRRETLLGMKLRRVCHTMWYTIKTAPKLFKPLPSVAVDPKSSQ